MRFGIGQPVSRKEDRRFLTGQGQYVADIELARQTYAVFVYSPHEPYRLKVPCSNVLISLEGLVEIFLLGWGSYDVIGPSRGHAAPGRPPKPDLSANRTGARGLTKPVCPGHC